MSIKSSLKALERKVFISSMPIEILHKYQGAIIYDLKQGEDKQIKQDEVRKTNLEEMANDLNISLIEAEKLAKKHSFKEQANYESKKQTKKN
jgi:hypothetical protein